MSQLQLLPESEVTSNQKNGLHINDLPSELLGRILGELDDKERFSIIPLVSPHFRCIHKLFPPTCKRVAVWGRGYEGSIEPLERVLWESEAPVQQISMVASSLVTLRLLKVDKGDYPQLLAAVALAPNLHHLEIEGCVDFLTMDSLAHLSQLRKLSIDHVSLPETLATEELHSLPCLTGLRSLEEIRWYIDVDDELDAHMVQGLWKALASLSSLKTLALYLDEFVFPTYNVPPRDDYFLDIPLLTQISCLKLHVGGRDGDRDYRVSQAFKGLTALKKLEVWISLWPAGFEPILALPLLEDLMMYLLGQHIWELKAGGEAASPRFSQLPPSLTSLCIWSQSFEQWLPVVPQGLRKLQLSDISSLPDSLAVMMPFLTALLLHETRFTHLPPQLAQLSSLQLLDLRLNTRLQLNQSDADLVLSLPCLQTLVAKAWDDLPWSEESKRALSAISIQGVSVTVGIQYVPDSRFY